MPMDKRFYPHNWTAITRQKKDAANWTCERCGRSCRIPGEDLSNFALRVQGIAHPDLDWINQTAIATIYQHPQRFLLTVAHLDQNPLNNTPENLKALCAPCHLRHDRPYRQFNIYRKRERLGQQRLRLELE